MRIGEKERTVVVEPLQLPTAPEPVYEPVPAREPKPVREPVPVTP
jgi:hypothetical protein